MTTPLYVPNDTPLYLIQKGADFAVLRFEEDKNNQVVAIGHHTLVYQINNLVIDVPNYFKEELPGVDKLTLKNPNPVVQQFFVRLFHVHNYQEEVCGLYLCDYRWSRIRPTKMWGD